MWTETQKLKPNVPYDGDCFGNAIALEGDTAIIAANHWVWDTGAVYVFARTAGVWAQTQQLDATESVFDGYNMFGTSVALRGDTLVIGQPTFCNIGDCTQPIVYFYTRSGGVWTEQQKLKGPFDLYPQNNFGAATAFSADTVIAGADREAPEGLAYVFTLDNGVWPQQQQLFASDASMGDKFSSSLALDGDTLLIGAKGNDVGANTDQGSTYVFTRSGGVWTEQLQLTANDGAANDRFGEVLLSGDFALIAAETKNIGANSEQGAVYAFARSGGVWSQAQQLTASDGAADDHFGSLALSGNTALVGARDKNVSRGAVYVFGIDGIGGGGAGGSTTTGGGNTGGSTTTGGGGNSGGNTNTGGSANTGGTGTMGGTTDTGGSVSTGATTTTGDGGSGGDDGGGCNGNGDGGCNAAGTRRGGGSVLTLALALIALARRRNRRRSAGGR